MSGVTNGHEVLLDEPQQFFPRSLPIPEARLQAYSPIIFKRADSSSTTSSSSSAAATCDPKDKSCESYFKPSDNTLPIVLGVVIPLAVAFCVLIFLHRRHVRKLRREDAEDKTRSLDFGMDGVQYSEKYKKGKRGGPNASQMSAADAVSQVRGRGGISLDMTMSSPYLLPPELHQSRESLHSLSRSLNTGDDKYRATDFIPDDGSIRSPSSLKSHWDNSSTYTGSSRPRVDSESTKNLISPPARSEKSAPQIRKPLPVVKDTMTTLTVPTLDDSARDSYLSTNSSNGHMAALRASNNYLGAFISGGQTKEGKKPDVTVAELDSRAPVADVSKPLPARIQEDKRISIVANTAGFNFDVPSDVQELPSRYSRQSPGDHPSSDATQQPQVNVTSPDGAQLLSPPKQQRRQSSMYDDNFATFQNHPNAYAWPPGHGDAASHDSHVQTNGANTNNTSHSRNTSKASHGPSRQSASTVGKHRSNTTGQYQAQSHYRESQRSGYSQPSDNHHQPQEDFYEEDEYDIEEYQDVLGYDPRLLTMGMRPLPPDDPSENPEERAIKIRSFYKEYFDETAKPGGGNRMSYFDGSENYVDDYYGTTNSSLHGSRGPSMMRPATQQQRHRAMSNGSYGPRAFSSASGRYGRPPFRPPPKKRLAPPQPLLVLPTPSKLKDDSMLPNAIDYAPPQVFKNQRSGTPDSMQGGLRPYSPSARAFNPLVSSFDDLAVLPSPHMLRKSGTFTSLDFAPPRYAAEAPTSDAGSIRSNRSGVSALHQHNIRAGAYRISRLPKEVAGTKDDLASALRPQWNMNR